MNDFLSAHLGTVIRLAQEALWMLQVPEMSWILVQCHRTTLSATLTSSGAALQDAPPLLLMHSRVKLR